MDHDLFVPAVVIVIAVVALLLLRAKNETLSALCIRSRIESVNFHFTRQCNYDCAFCFHTAKTSHVEHFEKIQTTLRLLKKAGMLKINFAGGEPFLKQKLLSQMCRFCKEELGLTVSIISNGSKITQEWLTANRKYVDMLGVSIDSSDNNTSEEIGRKSTGQTVNHTAVVRRVAQWCHELHLPFKINTVVCSLNKDESMAELIEELKPMRWKVFQVLPVNGENAGEGAKRNVAPLLISKSEFDAYVERHKHIECMKIESNSVMQNSYVLVDEYLRFLDCGGGGKTPSPPIYEVGVQKALEHVVFDRESYIARDGNFFKQAAPSTPHTVGDIEDVVE